MTFPQADRYTTVLFIFLWSTASQEPLLLNLTKILETMKVLSKFSIGVKLSAIKIQYFVFVWNWLFFSKNPISLVNFAILISFNLAYHHIIFTSSIIQKDYFLRAIQEHSRVSEDCRVRVTSFSGLLSPLKHGKEKRVSSVWTERVFHFFCYLALNGKLEVSSYFLVWNIS